MDFVIHTGNHNNSNGIGDTVQFLRSVLRDCGHRAIISPTIVPGRVNLLLEHFVEERHLRELLDGHAAGARYVLIGTEPIIGGRFNGGIDDKHWHYSNTKYWQVRFDTFKIAARVAEAIWVLAESMLPGYAELFPNLPVRFLPHGWASDFASVKHRPEVEKDVDFFFSGSMTEHRQRLLGDLARRHRVIYQAPDAPDYLRQEHLSRTKVCLSLRLSETNRIPSISRMHFYLQNRCFMLHEAYELPCPLDPFVLSAPTADLAAWAEAALHLPNRREIADGVHEQFKAAVPMTRVLPPLVDEVLARIARPTTVLHAA